MSGGGLFATVMLVALSIVNFVTGLFDHPAGPGRWVCMIAGLLCLVAAAIIVLVDNQRRRRAIERGDL